MEIHLKLTNLQPKIHLILIWKIYKMYKDFAIIENRLPLFIYNKLLNIKFVFNEKDAEHHYSQ